MCIKNRLIEYCNRKHIAISYFEKHSGLSNGYFNQVKKRPSIEKIESINRAFPDLNTDWLLTGEGDMLRNVAIIQQIGDKSSNNMQLAGTSDVVMLKKENEHLKELLQEKERTIKILMGQR